MNESLRQKRLIMEKTRSSSQTETGTLAICDLNAHSRLAPQSAVSASNRSVILEFQTENVDEEFERRNVMGVQIVSLLRRSLGEIVPSTLEI